MPPEVRAILLKPPAHRWLRLAAILWIAAVSVLLVKSYIIPLKRSVYPCYARAGQHWLEGTGNYELMRNKAGDLMPQISGFRYSPLVAAFFSPFSLFPDSWGSILWRAGSYGCYAWALSLFLRYVVPGGLFYSIKQRAAWWLLLLALSLPSMNNAQANVPMLALLLLAAVAVVRERWNFAALLLAGAFFLKLYPLAIVLLFVLIHPKKLGWRFAAATLLGLALPFALQDPGYVYHQYESWLRLLIFDRRGDFPLDKGYQDFHLLTRCIGYSLSFPVLLTVQLGAALAVALFCLRGRLADRPHRHQVHALMTLGCCWMLLFGPATESCTYTLNAPFLTWALVDAFSNRRSIITRGLLLIVLGLCLGNSMANWFPWGRYVAFGFLPLATLLFFVERFCFLTFFAEAARIASFPLRLTYQRIAVDCTDNTVIKDAGPLLGEPSVKCAVKILCALTLAVGMPALVRAQETPAACANRCPSPCGTVIILGGVGGMDLISSTAHSCLPRAGVRHDIREFVWTHGRGKPIQDLQDFTHVRVKAEELADIIRRLKAEDPDRPVFIVAKSGGSGVALLAAELLPANTLERVVLLSAAVSPCYDLRRALRATHGEIVSFHSPCDQFILNFGTRQFGTIDRVYGPSAGLHGFTLPDEDCLSDDDRILYRRLVQVPWNARMLLELNSGMHFGTSLPAFLMNEVAPWLR